MKKLGITGFVIFAYVFSLSVYAQSPKSKKESEGSINKSPSQTTASTDLRAKVMLDNRLWMSENLNIKISESYCHKDDPDLCDKYGRLYTWEAAKRACDQIGGGWRLPTNEEWFSMVHMYGGLYNNSGDTNQDGFSNLSEGGNAGFNALFGGNREPNGQYERLEAHGFYWTSTEYDSAQAWFYNFAKGSALLNRHTGNKKRALSVRCINDLEN